MDYIFSENKVVNLLRILSVISLFFILPNIFINIATIITLFLIMAIALIVFLVFKKGGGGNEMDAIQLATISGVILFVGFVFIILSKVIFILFLFFSITIFIVQEWVYRVFFAFQNSSDFFECGQKNLWDWICYLTIPIFSILSFYNITQNSVIDLEVLSSTKVLDVFNIIEQIKSNDNVINSALRNYSHGLKAVEGLSWNVFKYSSYVVIPYTASQFLITFINKA